MRLLAFISVIASLLMLLLMYLFYSPILDSPDATNKQRFLIISTLILQLYFLCFSVYASIKGGALIKWETEGSTDPAETKKAPLHSEASERNPTV